MPIRAQKAERPNACGFKTQVEAYNEQHTVPSARKTGSAMIGTQKRAEYKNACNPKENPEQARQGTRAKNGNTLT